jgi:4-hydroxybenzoate polyprenyltransferase
MTYLPQTRRVVSLPAPIERSKRASLTSLLKCLRLHQWAKNGLVLVPVILGTRAFDGKVLAAVMAAFAALCLIASATYVINDIVDLKHDQQHWSKRNRPIASGAVSLSSAWTLAWILALAGTLLSQFFAATAVTCGLIIYLITSLAYSLLLKRFVLIDVLVLAWLFTLRIWIGVAASGVALSPWLLTFSMFLFLSLSLAKRHTETSRAADHPFAVNGRGYRDADRPFLLALGIGALVAGVLVFVLYLTQEAFLATRLASPYLLWGFPPIVFLFGARIWLLSGRGELDDDPVAFAVKDGASLSLMGMTSLLLAVAWIGLPF